MLAENDDGDDDCEFPQGSPIEGVRSGDWQMEIPPQVWDDEKIARKEGRFLYPLFGPLDEKDDEGGKGEGGDLAGRGLGGCVCVD